MAAGPKLSLTEYTTRVLVTLAVVGVTLLLWRWLHVFLLVFGAILVAVIQRALADPIGRYTRVNQRWSLFFSIDDPLEKSVRRLRQVIGNFLAFDAAHRVDHRFDQPRWSRFANALQQPGLGAHDGPAAASSFRT